MDPWVAAQAERIADHAEHELAELVAVSSPSGDVGGAEAAVAVVRSLLPEGAEVERVPCSTSASADDLVARVRGTGTRRLLLLGHLDTVVEHGGHQSLRRDGERLVGSGSVDMKGGDVLAIGVLRALAETAGAGPEFAEVALLLVNDEEWRTVPFAHTERFAGFDACLCFEAGEQTPDGDDAVIVRRKAAGTLRVRAHGREAHSGSAPHLGASALLALSKVAQIVAAASDPQGPHQLTAVPTILRSGEAFNVVPAKGELICDLRATTAEAFDHVQAALPDEIDGVRLEHDLLRRWPGMDTRVSTAPLLERAGALLDRPLVPASRGGASDASHMASAIPLTLDGLGPRGGGAHAPHEYVLAESLHGRAEVALALAAAALADEPRTPAATP